MSNNLTVYGMTLAASGSEARAAAEAKAGQGSVCVGAYRRAALIHMICQLALAYPPDPVDQDFAAGSIEATIDKVLRDYHTPTVKGGRSALLNDKIAAVAKRESVSPKTEPVFQGRTPTAKKL